MMNREEIKKRDNIVGQTQAIATGSVTKPAKKKTTTATSIGKKKSADKIARDVGPSKAYVDTMRSIDIHNRVNTQPKR